MMEQGSDKKTRDKTACRKHWAHQLRHLGLPEAVLLKAGVGEGARRICDVSDRIFVRSPGAGG